MPLLRRTERCGQAKSTVHVTPVKKRYGLPDKAMVRLDMDVYTPLAHFFPLLMVDAPHASASLQDEHGERLRS